MNIIEAKQLNTKDKIQAILRGKSEGNILTAAEEQKMERICMICSLMVRNWSKQEIYSAYKKILKQNNEDSEPSRATIYNHIREAEEFFGDIYSWKQEILKSKLTEGCLRNIQKLEEEGKLKEAAAYYKILQDMHAFDKPKEISPLGAGGNIVIIATTNPNLDTDVKPVKDYEKLERKLKKKYNLQDVEEAEIIEDDTDEEV